MSIYFLKALLSHILIIHSSDLSDDCLSGIFTSPMKIKRTQIERHKQAPKHSQWPSSSEDDDDAVQAYVDIAYKVHFKLKYIPFNLYHHIIRNFKKASHIKIVNFY